MDYLSEYKQQIEKLNQELSAIKEAGCRYGELCEDLEEHKRLMTALKETEDDLKKSFANVDSLMEEAKGEMDWEDWENEQEEKRRKEGEKENEKRRKKSKMQSRIASIIEGFVK